MRTAVCGEHTGEDRWCYSNGMAGGWRIGTVEVFGLRFKCLRVKTSSIVGDLKVGYGLCLNPASQVFRWHIEDPDDL